jgi:class 3 adenylate cyclase
VSSCGALSVSSRTGRRRASARNAERSSSGAARRAARPPRTAPGSATRAVRRSMHPALRRPMREPRVPPPRTRRGATPPAKILRSRGSLEGERKQVTVLFADIKGSTELVSALDPEEASGVLDPALRAMMDAVHRYEGTVNRVQGDGLMAMFGAPIAHEDHALRACHSVLAMQRAVRETGTRLPGGRAVELRVGLHTGEVVVRAIDHDLSMSRVDRASRGPHGAARRPRQHPPHRRHPASRRRLRRGRVAGADPRQEPPKSDRGLRARRDDRRAHPAGSGRDAGAHSFCRTGGRARHPVGMLRAGPLRSRSRGNCSRKVSPSPRRRATRSWEIAC